MGEHPFLVVYEADEKLTFGPLADSPARYRVSTTYRGWRADLMRAQIRSEGLAKVAENGRRWYENQYGPTRSAEPIHLEDRIDDNELVLVELFELAKPWQASAEGDRVSFSTPDDVVGPQLTTRRTGARRAPIDLGLPRVGRRTLEIELPMDWHIRDWDDEWICGPQRMVSTLSSSSKRNTRLAVSFSSNARMLEPGLAESYFAFCEKARSSATLTLSHPARNGAFIATKSKASRASVWRDYLPSWVLTYRTLWFLAWAALILGRVLASSGGH